ncbi:hypothetical protein PGRAN_09511 [Listeria grandensis FSL F6-0971]|uniref:Uncharacterized protein n=1 Tax=Listeria grandensis FSL F6-0971 TaxID=1265819 RepID=W7B7A3_9LIST|nr:hypothetical protein [Listeria grandensis]EUJ23159.1 hypothetical protein PGRAN_09511 [Listeria grandensis FSL F6-0971]
MREIKVSLCIVVFLLTGVTLSSLHVFADEIPKSTDTSIDNLVVENIKRLEYSMPDNAPDDLIDLYLNDGWKWNKELNYMYKDVRYADETVNINGLTYITDENGEVSTKISVRTGEGEVTVSSPNYDTNPVSIEAEINEEAKKVIVEKGEQKKVSLVEEINLDTLINRMDEENGHETEKINKAHADKFMIIPLAPASKFKFEKVVKSYSKGARITCNRFNGPWGNNKYYLKSENAVMAARNFLWSDCDRALVWHVQCLKDYGLAKYRYCAWEDKSKNGKCSGLIGHGKTYHAH